MEALEAQGNVAEALRVFEGLRALLREELGITPSPDAIAAHERLVRPGAPAGEGERDTAEEPVPLPVELRARAASTMVGREPELAELEAWLPPRPHRGEPRGGRPAAPHG